MIQDEGKGYKQRGRQKIQKYFLSVKINKYNGNNNNNFTIHTQLSLASKPDRV